MRKFFQCKNTLSENELLASFKYKMLTIMIVLLIISSLLVALYYMLGFGSITNHEHYLRYIHVVLGLIFFSILRYNKKSYNFVSYGLIFVTLILFSYALVDHSNNEIKMLWFVVITVAAFISNGIKLGILTAVLSASSILLINSFFDLNIGDFTLLSVLSSLFVISIMLYYFTKKIDDFSRDLGEQNCRLERLASSDALTGIMSRRFFLEMANKYLHQSRRNDENFYFLMLDIDHFKKINDTYGHQEGDKVLITYTEVIEELLRENDLFGRLGGEEFGIVILEKTTQHAMIIAERIRSAIESKIYMIRKEPLPVTVSIGISLNCQKCSLEEVMHRADNAMYEAKKQGRNQVCFRDTL